MDSLAAKLDTRPRTWRPETAAEVRERVSELIEVGGASVLNLPRSRARERALLDILDEPPNAVRLPVASNAVGKGAARNSAAA